MEYSKKIAACAMTALLGTTSMAMAQDCADPVKIGVLHSLSGTMAISETTLKDTMLMLVDAQNKKGGVLGCQIEAVVDPASDWPLFAEKGRELLTVNEVDVIFGSWTSVSRKSVLPVLEELNGLMFYPVQYEGEESSQNVFYTGAAPNQQAIPAVDYYLEELGVEKFALLGTDYVYPRTTNNILKSYLMSKGIAEEDIFVNYTPFGHSDWATIVGDVVALGEDGKQVGVIRRSTATRTSAFTKNWPPQMYPQTTSPSLPFRWARKNSPVWIPRTLSGIWPRGTTSCRLTRLQTLNSSRPGRRSSVTTSA
jgi:urea transport system substrate-binding protein